ncbi:MAG: phenylacetate--CoA ligase [Euryarchaeota archaeon]|nr:phenylacetate--CoA ligase [Euryarchaeota archaeon]
MKASYFQRGSEQIDRKALDALQLRRLRATAKLVYQKVPFYKGEMKRLGVAPGDIRRLSDITKLPFTVKNDLRDAYPFGMMAAPLEKCVELHASSGTTGKPVTVCYTPHDLDVWSDVMARCLTMSGLTKKDVFQNPIPYGLFTGAFGFHYGAQKVGALVVPAGGGQTERQLQLMMDYGVTFISGVASYAAHLGQKAAEMGLNPAKDLKVRNGLFGAEFFTSGLKERISEAWDMDVHDIYGLTEMCGPGVSTDCDMHDGLHLWEDHFIVEILDPKTLEPVEAEEEGEVVLTTITKEGMPLLRYRTRDISFLLDTRKCECGRTHVKHAPVKARTDDMFIVKGTNVYPSQVESVLMRFPAVGSNYRIVLYRTGLLDQMRVEVEARRKMPDRDAEILAREIQDGIHSVVTLRPEVKVLPPGSIEQVTVKAKRVVDERPK